MTIAVSMLEKLMGAFLPGLVRMIAHVPVEQKDAFIRLLSSLCSAYLNNDRPLFDHYLQFADLPDHWRQSLSLAVWGADVNPD